MAGSQCADSGGQVIYLPTGQHMKAHQFANDWIAAYDDDGRDRILNPTTVLLETEHEVEWFREHRHVGRFWELFELTDDRRFRKLVVETLADVAAEAMRAES